MSKSKSEANPVASTLTSIADQISSESLTKAVRQQLRSRNGLVPDQLVEMICHLAEQGNGAVAGMPFDAAAARATLAQTSTTRTTISVGRQTLQRMEDDMIQQRATATDPAFAIYTALRRLVKTKAGNSLSPAYEQMKAIVKNRPRKPRAKNGKGKTAKTTSASTPAVEVPAVVAPPAPPQAPAPKAVASTSN
jgi:hypothetical protein